MLTQQGEMYDAILLKNTIVKQTFVCEDDLFIVVAAPSDYLVAKNWKVTF